MPSPTVFNKFLKVLKIVFKLSIAVLSIYASILLTEKVLIATHYQFKPLLVDQDIDVQTAFYAYDKDLIYTSHYLDNNALPNQVGLTHQLQLRPDSIPNTQVDDDTFTIATFGDSFTYGHNLANEDTYPAQLESYLAKSGYKVNVFNAGVSGYGTDQEYLAIKKFLSSYQPNLVIINLNENDIYDSNDNCLFKAKTDDGYAQVTGETSNIYLQYYALTHVPPVVKKSRLLNLVLYDLSRKGRSNLLCTEFRSVDVETLMLRKMGFLISKLNRELPTKTKLMLTMVPLQNYFNPKLGNDDEQLTRREKIIHQLHEFPILDINTEIARKLYPATYALREIQDTAEGVTSLDTRNAQFDGVTLAHPEYQLFLNDTEEPESPFGLKHPNPIGDHFFAEIVGEKIIKKYLTPFNNSLQ